MAHLRWQLALLFLSCLALALAAKPTTFCKCTCFSNSTIIPLDRGSADGKSHSRRGDFVLSHLRLPHNLLTPPDSPASSAARSRERALEEREKRARTCSECNKQFCLEYHLPICSDAKEDDVVTSCFQRDSTKDQLIVYIFILATGSLLLWALLKPWWDTWRDRRGTSFGTDADGSQGRGMYTAVNDPMRS